MDNTIDLALLILRLGIGLTLFAHGYNKFFKGGRIAGTAGWFDSIGMRPGKLHAMLAASGEITAGLFLAAGLLTSFAALGIVGLMCVAGWVVHRNNGFMITSEGWEYTFVLAVMAIGIATHGPGEWSLDELLGIGDDLGGWTGLVISAVGGVSAATLLLSIFYHPPKPEASAPAAPPEPAAPAEPAPPTG